MILGRHPTDDSYARVDRARRVAAPAVRFLGSRLSAAINVELFVRSSDGDVYDRDLGHDRAGPSLRRGGLAVASGNAERCR
jgi:hypothetical protein